MNLNCVDLEMGFATSGVFAFGSPGAQYFVGNSYIANQDVARTFATTLTIGAEDVTRRITSEDISDYAEALVQVGMVLQINKPDIVLIPLRGGLKLWKQLEAMCLHRHKAFKILTTGLGAGRADETRIKNLLRPILCDKATSSALSIAVVDTAKGGDGSVALANLLKALHAEAEPRAWCVHFHLLVPRGARAIGRVGELYRLTTNTFACLATNYEVGDLLVEDWECAYGIRGTDEISGGEVFVKALSATTERLGVIEGEHAYVIESRRMYDAFNNLISHHVTEAMITDPKLEQVADLSEAKGSVEEGDMGRDCGVR